jgi:hypothetical protein
MTPVPVTLHAWKLRSAKGRLVADVILETGRGLGSPSVETWFVVFAVARWRAGLVCAEARDLLGGTGMLVARRSSAKWWTSRAIHAVRGTGTIGGRAWGLV